MGSGLDAIIAQGIKPGAVPNPWGFQQEYNQAQEGQQQNQLNALKIQEAKQQMASQAAIQRAYTESQGDLDKAIPAAAQYGALPGDLIELQKQSAAQKKAVADLSKEDLELHDKHTATALSTLAPLLTMSDDQAAAQYPTIMGAIIKDHDLQPNDLAKLGLDPATYPGHDTFQHVINGLNGYQKTIADEQNSRKIAAEESNAKTNATKENAELPGQIADSTVKQSKADAIKALKDNPASATAEIDNVFPPSVPGNAGPNARYKSQVAFYLSRGDFDKVDKVIEAANLEAGTVAKETNPQVQSNKVATAVAQARATQPVKLELAAAEAAARNNANNPVGDFKDITYTTGSGRQYINQADLGKNRQALVRAQAAGIPVVDPATHETLEEIDNARANMNYMLSRVQKKLATDPTGRLFTAPGNTIEKLAQTDPDLAAMGTYRTAAIQGMRAVAGSKGLRINKAEIEAAQENDIPKATDTLPVAKQKIANMMAFLDNTEAAHLTHDRRSMATPPPAAGASNAGGFKAGDKRTVNGKTYVRDGNGVWTAQ